MDENTKEKAIEKLQYMIYYVGYPNEFFHDEKLNEYYQDLEVYTDSYLKNRLSLSLFNTKHSLAQFGKPINRKNWINHGISTVVNAYYNALQNSIGNDLDQVLNDNYTIFTRI